MSLSPARSLLSASIATALSASLMHMPSFVSHLAQYATVLLYHHHVLLFLLHPFLTLFTLVFKNKPAPFVWRFSLRPVFGFLNTHLHRRPLFFFSFFFNEDKHGMNLPLCMYVKVVKYLRRWVVCDRVGSGRMWWNSVDL